MIKVLVTGGCGFIGSHFIRIAKTLCPDWSILNIDKLTYAGTKVNLKGLPEDNYKFIQGDICNRHMLENNMEDVEYVFNFAAESHVDTSIKSSYDFVRTNVLGAQVLLEASRKAKVTRFVQISTDEVYGSLPEIGDFTEKSPLSPNNPYAATKASADLIALSYYVTYGMDVVITRCSNNYGPNQHVEKMIPSFVGKIMDGIPVPIYGDGQQVRDWIHVYDHCEGIIAAARRGEAGQIYNFGGCNEITNLALAKKLALLLGQPAAKMSFVTDRPGHDRRYAMNFSKANRELAWKPSVKFDVGLAQTVEWYKKMWE